MCGPMDIWANWPTVGASPVCGFSVKPMIEPVTYFHLSWTNASSWSSESPAAHRCGLV